MHAFEDIIIPIITICRVSAAKAIKFKPGLGLKEHNIILSKRKPAIQKIKKLFLNEKNAAATQPFWLQNWFLSF